MLGSVNLSTIESLEYETGEAWTVVANSNELVNRQNAAIVGLNDEKTVLDGLFSYLAEVVSIHELNLGYDHPETADAYSKIPLAYQEAGRY